MKKIILAAALIAFSFSAQAATTTTNVCIDINAAIQTQQTEDQILNQLIAAPCSMNLVDAAKAIIAAGGNQGRTLTAALIIDPNLDPTTVTAASAAIPASGTTGNTPRNTIGTTTTNTGGASPA